ncbi:MAG TPA: efflux transporter outer membrane subunit [Vicinamibacterales bacterium]|nr:efflux transporter outer membrane subunit [Vicinamibacterales bacterium]
MRRIAGTLIAVVFTAGCMVGPTYHRPPIAGTPAFKEAPPEGWKNAEPNEGLPRGPWWEIYSDPQLNDLVSKVELSNQNVIAAMARYREAVDQVQIARAALFPTVTATPSAVVTKGSSLSSRGQVISGGSSGTTSTSSGGGPGTGSSRSGSGVNVNYAMPFDISYQADIWGNIRRSVTASQDMAQASAADLENAKLTFQAQLAQMYFQLHGLDADADLLRRNVAIFEQSLQLTQNRFNAGVASGADVAQARTQLESTRAQLIDVGVGRAQFEHAIAVLVGETPAMVSVPEKILNSPPPQIPIGVASTLMERRPDVAATERAIAAANEQIGIAKAAYFPTLTLSGTGGFVSTNLAKLFTVPSLFWAMGPQLAATLFDGGQRKGQVRFSQEAYDESVATYRQTVLTAFQQVEDQLSSLRILEQEQATEAAARQAAQDAVDIAVAQYQAGTADYLAVIVLQAALLQAQRLEIDILTRRLTASVLLIEALGGGWDQSQLPSY